jgi:hypothetical protein
MRTLIVLGLAVALGAVAGAEKLNQVVVGDLPGTDGNWQAGEVTVAAPAHEVQSWFSDAPAWPKRFPDDQWATDKGRGSDGRKTVEFRSKVLGRNMTLHIKEQPGLIAYDGQGKDVNTQGKIFITPLGPDKTKVVMQTTGEVHGAAGVFAGKGMKRKKAIAKLTSDLNAVVKLANEHPASAPAE